MIIPVSTAPLGYSQARRRQRRSSASTIAADAVALTRTTADCRMPATGIASASRIPRMIVSSPFGVLKNRICTAEASGLEPFERRRDEQPLDVVLLEQRDAALRPEDERGRGERVRQHCRLGDDGDARDIGYGHLRRRPEDVRPAVPAAPLV